MQKVGLFSMAAVLVLTACSGPKSKVIPSDPQKWDQISDDVKKLSDDDRKEFMGFVMRMGMASALAGGKGGIAPGTTIGDAISQQKEWEAKQQAEEAQAAVLKAKIDAQKAADAARINQVSTLAVTGLHILPTNAMAGRFSERLDMEIAIQNKSQRAISGVKGVLEFKDQFGSEISKLNVSLNEDIAAGQTRTISGYGRDLNQFDETDKKLASIPFDRMRITFTPEMVVFADGSKIGTSEGSAE